MTQNKEKHKATNRKNMAEKRRKLKEKAKNGDLKAVKEYSEYLSYHRNKTAQNLNKLRSRATKGDNSAISKLDSKKHDGITNIITSFIKNKASSDQLDKLTDLIDQRKSMLLKEKDK